jgi:hypothetical protein
VTQDARQRTMGWKHEFGQRAALHGKMRHYPVSRASSRADSGTGNARACDLRGRAPHSRRWVTVMSGTGQAMNQVGNRARNESRGGSLRWSASC